jgi:3-methyladenine DNA glycosylase/8-oxoguanine DNA glycosylase
MAIQTTKDIIDYLIKQDTCFQSLHDEFGLIKYEDESNVFESIVFTIVGQMLSNKAASTIYGRIAAVLKDITPVTVLQADTEALRRCGSSYAKIKYIKNFASLWVNHELDFDSLIDKSDQEVITYLTRIDGIGAWTAEMIALFTFGRQNIFSFNDVALKSGI